MQIGSSFIILVPRHCREEICLCDNINIACNAAFIPKVNLREFCGYLCFIHIIRARHAREFHWMTAASSEFDSTIAGSQ